MRVALPIVAAATLLCKGCYLPFEGEAHFIYGSNLDVPGDNLLIWPVDEYGNAFRRTTQLSEGLRMLSEGHVFTMPHTGDWRMAGSVVLEGVVVILPPDPGPELRERASEISAGVSRAYPRASVHLVKTRIEPYGLESVGQLEAKLRDAWYEHMGTRSRFMTDAIASEVGRELSVLAVAEFVILPLAGEEIRYAVVAPVAGFGLHQPGLVAFVGGGRRFRAGEVFAELRGLGVSAYTEDFGYEGQLGGVALLAGYRLIF